MERQRIDNSSENANHSPMDLFASLSQQLPETEIALLAEAMEEDPTHCLLLNH